MSVCMENRDSDDPMEDEMEENPTSTRCFVIRNPQLDKGQRSFARKVFAEYQGIFALYQELRHRSTKTPLFLQKNLSYMINDIPLFNGQVKEIISEYLLRPIELSYIEGFESAKIVYKIFKKKSLANDQSYELDYELENKSLFKFSSKKSTGPISWEDIVFKLARSTDGNDDYEHMLAFEITYFRDGKERIRTSDYSEMLQYYCICMVKGENTCGQYEQKLIKGTTKNNSIDWNLLFKDEVPNKLQDVPSYFFESVSKNYFFTYELTFKSSPLSNRDEKENDNIHDDHSKQFNSGHNIENFDSTKVQVSFKYLQESLSLFLENFECPFCDINCNNFNSLTTHLKICHDRLTFQFEQNPLKIKVAIAEPNYMIPDFDHHEQYFLNTGKQKNRIKRRKVQTTILVSNEKRNYWHNLNNKCGDHSTDTTMQIVADDEPSGRIYFHSQTCVPILQDELDINSEDEEFSEWNKQRTIAMIDEFSDVNPGEKEIAKLWNLHVMNHCKIILGDCHIEHACELFVEEHGKEIVEKNLRMNFILHLCNLQAFGLIRATMVEHLSKKINAIASVGIVKM